MSDEAVSDDAARSTGARSDDARGNQATARMRSWNDDGPPVRARRASTRGTILPLVAMFLSVLVLALSLSPSLVVLLLACAAFITAASMYESRTARRVEQALDALERRAS